MYSGDAVSKGLRKRASQARQEVRSRKRWILAALVLLGAVCAGTAPSLAQPGRPARLVVLGDSLSAGYLLPQAEAFPAVLEQALLQRGYSVSVANAAVSGDTTSGGLARLDRDVPDGTDGVILQLGANDRLRRVDPEVTRGALEQIVTRLGSRGIAVLLAGVRFSDEGEGDVARFNGVFPAVARRYRLPYYPDFYRGISTNPRFTIFDGVHPSSEGVRWILGGILPSVERFVRTLPARAGARPRQPGSS